MPNRQKGPHNTMRVVSNLMLVYTEIQILKPSSRAKKEKKIFFFNIDLANIRICVIFIVILGVPTNPKACSILRFWLLLRPQLWYGKACLLSSK